MTMELTFKEKRDLAIQSGMQLLPYVGGALSSLYFGAKQERRIKRIESFYQEISSEISALKDKIKPVENNNSEELEFLLELLHEKIEVEATQQKRLCYKNYFKNSLIVPLENQFDTRRYFLDSLSSMSLLELELLAFIKNEKSTTVGCVEKKGTDQYAIIGAIERLRSRGFLKSSQQGLSTSGDNFQRCSVSLSDTGKEFHDFCIESQMTNE